MCPCRARGLDRAPYLICWAQAVLTTTAGLQRRRGCYRSKRRSGQRGRAAFAGLASARCCPTIVGTLTSALVQRRRCGLRRRGQGHHRDGRYIGLPIQCWPAGVGASLFSLSAARTFQQAAVSILRPVLYMLRQGGPSEDGAASDPEPSPRASAPQRPMARRLHVQRLSEGRARHGAVAALVARGPSCRVGRPRRLPPTPRIAVARRHRRHRVAQARQIAVEVGRGPATRTGSSDSIGSGCSGTFRIENRRAPCALALGQASRGESLCAPRTTRGRTRMPLVLQQSAALLRGRGPPQRLDIEMQSQSNALRRVAIALAVEDRVALCPHLDAASSQTRVVEHARHAHPRMLAAHVSNTT